MKISDNTVNTLSKVRELLKTIFTELKAQGEVARSPTFHSMDLKLNYSFNSRTGHQMKLRSRSYPLFLLGNDWFELVIVLCRKKRMKSLRLPTPSALVPGFLFLNPDASCLDRCEGSFDASR